jgi:hypothetical protein
LPASSMFTLTNATFPFAAATAFSTTRPAGPHAPHHGAWK